MDIDDEDEEWVGEWGGTTVGAVRGEWGARRDASCKVRRAWTLFRRAAISARSSAITPGDLEGMGATGRVGARGAGEGGGLLALGRARWARKCISMLLW